MSAFRCSVPSTHPAIAMTLDNPHATEPARDEAECTMRRVKKSTREVKRDTQKKGRCEFASRLIQWWPGCEHPDELGGGGMGQLREGLEFLSGGRSDAHAQISGGWAIILFDRHAGVIAGILRHMRVTSLRAHIGSDGPLSPRGLEDYLAFSQSFLLVHVFVGG